MFYLVVKKKGKDDETVAVCKAKDAREANRMVGVDEDSTAWTCFTEDQVKTLISTERGFLERRL